MKLLVSRQAAEDVQRLHAFLTEKNPRIAERAVEALVDAVESLEILPERGRPSGIPGIRELFVPFGQSAYNANNGEIVILRIWHGRETRE